MRTPGSSPEARAIRSLCRPAADGDAIRLDHLVRRTHPDDGARILDRRHRHPGADFSTGRADVIGQGCGHQLEVDPTGGIDRQGTFHAQVRFALGDLVEGQPPYRDTVLTADAEQTIELRELGLCRRDDELPGDVHRDALLLAVLLQRRSAYHGQSRLQGSGLVVQPGMHNPELCPVWCAATAPSFSSTTIGVPGSSRCKALATDRPTIPPPTTTAVLTTDPIEPSCTRDAHRRPPASEKSRHECP